MPILEPRPKDDDDDNTDADSSAAGFSASGTLRGKASATGMDSLSDDDDSGPHRRLRVAAYWMPCMTRGTVLPYPPPHPPCHHSHLLLP